MRTKTQLKQLGFSVKCYNKRRGLYGVYHRGVQVMCGYESAAECWAWADKHAEDKAGLAIYKYIERKLQPPNPRVKRTGARAARKSTSA